MRKVTFTFCPPSGDIKSEADLLGFMRSEAYLSSFLSSYKKLPSLAELNRVFASGSGDDGHFIIQWSPFTISGEEYAELANEFVDSTNQPMQ